MRVKRNRKYNTYSYCRFCKSRKIKKILDLGKQPLAGGFLRKNEFKKEKFYPLELYFCQNCFLVQTSVVIDSDVLFKNYYYYSSVIKTLSDHFLNNSKLFSNLFKNANKTSVLEIGCNDGSFIKDMSNEGFKILGIDPAKNIVGPLIKQGLPIINDYFSAKSANSILKKYGKMDLIVSTNTLAHITDMHDIIKGIKILLNDDGILYFENHYLGTLIKETQYDMVYHEHQYYYSLMALVNFLNIHDMKIFNVRRIPIHGGSMGYFVQKRSGRHKISQLVRKIIESETKQGLNKLSTYANFENKVKNNKKELMCLVKKIKKEKNTIAAYGASGRGTVISNYCKFSDNIIDYVIDDSGAKQGLFTPGIHLKIVPSNLNKENHPDYTILFAWTFLNEIKNRNKLYLINGGKFIIPLPNTIII